MRKCKWLMRRALRDEAAAYWPGPRQIIDKLQLSTCIGALQPENPARLLPCFRVSCVYGFMIHSTLRVVCCKRERCPPRPHSPIALSSSTKITFKGNLQ